MGPPLTRARRFRLGTSRLTLRPVRRDEVAELLPIFTDPDVRRHLLDDEVVGAAWVDDEVRRSDALFRELGFERVDPAADLPNLASIGVMERLGMEADRERTGAGSPGTVRYSLERDRWTGRS